MKSFARWFILLLSVGVTGYGLYAYLVLPPGASVHPAMKAAYEEHPGRIVTHVAFSAFALALGPLQFFPGLRARRRLHRWLGYLYFIGVIGGGLAGFCTAFIAYGGLVARVGFGMLALVWLWTALAAINAARRRDFEAHERWAVRSFALTFAAVTLRLYMPLFFAAGFAFEDFYPVQAWLCWVPNLLFVEWVLLRRRTG
ncbi:MAG: hypothetical protein QG602_1597 [Verrucomicrobiota bacterium]|nr:hypothetical protein [Verrucomicrobiota bacterium]